MIDPIAQALREMRGSANTEAAGWIDAEDATQLRGLARRLGWALVPLDLDDTMRAAIWQAQAARSMQSPEAAATYVATRVADPTQRAQDQAAWRALHAEAARRLGDV